MHSNPNAMRWDCGESGCFNIKHRAKFEVFADAIPGNRRLTDIDATVDVDGHFLFMEFKSGGPRDLSTGQRIYFERLTRLSDRITCVVVCGDAEKMTFTHSMSIYRGKFYPWQPSSHEDIYQRIERWAAKKQLLRMVA